MKKSCFFVEFLLISNFILISFVFAVPVYADVPEVVNVESFMRGSETILNITIEHEFPTIDHYIDLVQIDIDGIINDLNLTQQSTTYFTVEYSLGELSGEPAIRVRAHCTFHGWSSWSSVQTIPEFPSWIVLPLFLMSTLTIALFRGFARARSPKNKFYVNNSK